jgi:hypothetical protein
MQIPTDLVADAHEHWVKANSRFNTKKQLERELAEKEQYNDTKGNTADFSDINELFAEKGRGPHMLELDFQPVTQEATNFVSVRTGNETICWKWKHKYTGKEVNRYPTSSGKSFDTGVLSTALQRLNCRIHPVAFERAQHILRLNSKNGQANMANMEAGPVAVAVNREQLLTQWVSLALCHSFVAFFYTDSNAYSHKLCFFFFLNWNDCIGSSCHVLH